jgi:hypothetical protein
VDFVDDSLEVGTAAGDEDCCADWRGHFGRIGVFGR